MSGGGEEEGELGTDADAFASPKSMGYVASEGVSLRAALVQEGFRGDAWLAAQNLVVAAGKWN